MATYYLNADTGNNTTGTGTALNPWLTLAKAHTEATSGDTIVCQDSTAVYSWVTQTFTKALTITGESDDASGAVFDAGALAITTVWTHNANITLSKLTFQNLTNPTSWPGLIFNIATDGISFTMTQCKLGNIQVGGRNGFASHGVYGTTASRTGCIIRVENNLYLPTISSSNSSLGTGGHFFNFRSCPSNTFITRGNTFSIGNFTGEQQMQRMFEVVGATGSTLDLRNNIIYSVETQAIELVTGFASLASYQFTNNTYYTTGAAFTQIPTGGTNNETRDPLFVDVANDNYNLRPSSLEIDTGVLL